MVLLLRRSPLHLSVQRHGRERPAGRPQDERDLDGDAHRRGGGRPGPPILSREAPHARPDGVDGCARVRGLCRPPPSSAHQRRCPADRELRVQGPQARAPSQHGAGARQDRAHHLHPRPPRRHVAGFEPGSRRRRRAAPAGGLHDRSGGGGAGAGQEALCDCRWCRPPPQSHLGVDRSPRAALRRPRPHQRLGPCRRLPGAVWGR
mmetsp:Transcript_24880/g.62795  ORF Transcript_24880/g.62795 Transcript_24880/m.62795 type:complete len:205 (+) Transcript_24880:76-690(+)